MLVTSIVFFSCNCPCSKTPHCIVHINLEVTHTDAIEESEPPPKAVKVEEIIQEVEPEPLTTEDEDSKPKKQQGSVTSNIHACTCTLQLQKKTTSQCFTKNKQVN